MRSLRSSSIVCALATLATLALAPACTRASAKERTGEVPVGVATLQIGSVPTGEPRNAKVIPSPAPANELATKADAGACPDGMVLVEGEFCPEVEQTCLEWMDPPTSRYAHFRCARYDHDVKCKAARVHKRFCIDRTERV